jgi:hypothetical protein
LQSPFSSDPHQPQAFKYNKQARNSACFQSSFYKEQGYNAALLSSNNSNNNNNNDFENHNQSLLNKNESHKWTNLVDFVDKNQPEPAQPFHQTNLFNEALSKLNQQSTRNATTTTILLESSQQVERVVCEDNDDDEEDDDEMPIEELGREYLFRYSGIRRHTIGTNAEDNRISATKDIMKSTECLLMLNENDSSCSSQLLQSDNATSDDLETSASSRQTLYLFNLLSNDMNSINLLESSSNSNKTSSEAQQNFSRLLTSLAAQKQPSGVQLHASASSSNSLSLAGSMQPKKVQYADESHHHHHHQHHQHRGSHHHTHHHYGSAASSGSHHHHIQHHHNLKSQRTRNRMNGGAHHHHHHHHHHTNSSHIGQLLSLPINNGRRASDGGSNISLFNQFYSLKSGFNLASRRTNANYCDSIRSSFTNEDSLNRSPNANSCSHDDESSQIELNGLNIVSDEKDNGDDEIDNSDVSYPPTSKIFQSRGSITSGIYFYAMRFLCPGY